MQVFLCSTHNVTGEKLDALLEKLPPERAALCQKGDGAAHGVGFLLVAHAAKHLDPNADTSRWIIEPGGKPHLPGDTVHFSLSHAGALIAVAVSKTHPVGVDIEKIRPHREGFAARWFSLAEQAEIAAAKDPDVAMTLLWTKKEAAAKKCGTGLRFDLSRIDVAHTASSLLELDGLRYALSLAPAEEIATPIWIELEDLTP